MALSGLQIQKLLPKTNCKECGSNTCLAFAMKLASKKTDISKCPYASPEAIKTLGEAYELPVKSITMGPTEAPLKAGEETVLYRHKKTFVNKTLLAVSVDHTKPFNEQISKYQYERVGETFCVDMLALTAQNDDHQQFVDYAFQLWKKTKKPLIIKSKDINSLIEVALKIKGSRSVIYASSEEMIEALLPVIKENGHSLVFSNLPIDKLVEISNKYKKMENIFLDFEALSLSEQFQINSLARRAAIDDNFKPLGRPFVRFIDEGLDYLENNTQAILEINKYGGIIVLPTFDPAQISTLMTLRLNIYTDPQNPIQVEPKIYPVGSPDSNSPVFVTTNFSLTFYVVSSEIENSGLSAWLVIPECEGQSVLTAWAAGKFNGVSIAKFIKDIKLDAQVTTREITIPGHVAQISGELEENLPGWKVLVGPQEASEIESYIKIRLAG